MKVLILNGMRNQTPTMDSLLNEIVESMNNKGWDVESVVLRDKKITPCQGCFDCWVKTPGVCKTEDYGREILKKIIESNLIIQVTPITFGGYSSELKKVLDRSIPELFPFFKYFDGEIHHEHRYKNRASIIVLGFLKDDDIKKEDVFKELVYRNSLNFGAPLHKSIIYKESDHSSRFLKDFNSLLSEVENLS
ncbi:MAG: flavodoxin family protein [Candidatus Lokiarchaeota archaeon]